MDEPQKHPKSQKTTYDSMYTKYSEKAKFTQTESKSVDYLGLTMGAEIDCETGSGKFLGMMERF